MEQIYQIRCAMLVDLAKEYLICARINEQEAQMMSEFDVLYGPDHLPANLASDLRAEARENRTLARVALQRAEQINGRLYSQGKSGVPLRSSLNGQNFRAWDCYSRLYHGNSLFAGQDPG